MKISLLLSLSNKIIGSVGRWVGGLVGRWVSSRWSVGRWLLGLWSVDLIKPVNFRTGIIFAKYKKGDEKDSENYGPISLLNLRL